MSGGADSSRWIMEIKLCVCLVIKSNGRPWLRALDLLPRLCSLTSGRRPGHGHVVLIVAGASLVSGRTEKSRDTLLVLVGPRIRVRSRD